MLGIDVIATTLLYLKKTEAINRSLVAFRCDFLRKLLCLGNAWSCISTTVTGLVALPVAPAASSREPL